ncbi:MAG: hypothetical protein AB1567_01260 [bacterium]
MKKKISSVKETKDSHSLILEGPCGSLRIEPSDKLSMKLAMLFEGTCLSKHPSQVAAKYGFTKQRYYQILQDFNEGGSSAIIEKKKGPKRNYIRTESIVNQILRYKFLDPESSAEVIAQKITQAGTRISTRSVERTITEYGLQKKTPFVKSKQEASRNRNTSDKA